VHVQLASGVYALSLAESASLLQKAARLLIVAPGAGVKTLGTRFRALGAEPGFQVEVAGRKGVLYDRYPECWDTGAGAPNLRTFGEDLVRMGIHRRADCLIFGSRGGQVVLPLMWSALGDEVPPSVVVNGGCAMQLPGPAVRWPHRAVTVMLLGGQAGQMFLGRRAKWPQSSHPYFQSLHESYDAHFGWPEPMTDADREVVPSLPPPLPRDPRRSSTSFRLARPAESSALRSDSAPPGPGAPERLGLGERSEARLQALEQWRLDFGSGGPGAVRMSEFAEFTPLPTDDARREAYIRPANKRDLGHRCYHCRRPFSALGAEIVTEIQGGPTQRFHPECWRERGRRVPPLKLARRQASDVSEALEMSSRSTGGSVPLPSYAEEWRRASLDGSSIRARPASRGQSRSGRAPILDGVNAIE
ncbi:rnf141, partial [Symbiodinium necroappetens]